MTKPDSAVASAVMRTQRTGNSMTIAAPMNDIYRVQASIRGSLKTVFETLYVKLSRNCHLLRIFCKQRVRGTAYPIHYRYKIMGRAWGYSLPVHNRLVRAGSNPC